MPEIDPPWRLDPLQTIVDVHWTTQRPSAQWTFNAGFENSGALDCPLGPSATTISTTEFSLSGPTVAPHAGFTIAGSPSVAPTSISVGAGLWASLQFLAATKNGSKPGSANFDVIGLQCSSGSPSIGKAGNVVVTIPAITITETETGKVYELVEWSVSAVAGITVAASFKLKTQEP